MRLAQAESLLAAVQAYGDEHALRLSAAVVDARGHEVAAARMDGATWLTIGVAHVKARTAAWFGRPSGDLAAMRAAHPEVLRLAGAQLPEPPTDLPGGLPLYDEGGLLGALGVSGATPEEDVAAARAAIASCERRADGETRARGST
ncbi:GlcG/HbpS family heme-binding protein [Nocardioides sp. Iso805N]|uniref:GlcG/HbpS family heme-binding protein n=1 Tax=Nocardioides sp. Iso805N TaxID=1283287 RepID=UPI00037D4AC9|nr:heme-binding protein [Nocardioides sp. Iso805N]